MTEEKQTAETSANQQFIIHRIYTKDISFESPHSPEIFRAEKWEPDIDVQLNSKSRKVREDVYEIVLIVSVTAKLDNERTAYLAEVQQAGLFNMSGFPEDQLPYMVGSYCPNILFPFAREVISDLVTRGGFPQMVLSPVNFDALFQQQLQQAQQPSPEQPVQ